MQHRTMLAMFAAVVALTIVTLTLEMAWSQAANNSTPQNLRVPTPGFLIDIGHPLSLKFYFMELDEIESRARSAFNFKTVRQCRTLAGQLINEAFKTHPSRIHDISQANVLIFALGDDNEWNWPEYGNKAAAFVNGPPSECNRKHLTAMLNEFYNSQLVNVDILDAHRNIQRVLFLDTLVGRVRPRYRVDKELFVRFGINTGAKQLSSLTEQTIAFPPPLQRKAQRHSAVELNESYVIVFQGNCKDKPARYALAKVMKEIHDADVAINCLGGGRNRQDTAVNMLDLIKSSKFALNLPGDKPFTYRFAEILYLNTILVRISNAGDMLTLPFQHIIDWQQIAIHLDHTVLQDVETWRTVIEKLRNISDKRHAQMKRDAKNVQDLCFRDWKAKIHCLLMDLDFVNRM